MDPPDLYIRPDFSVFKDLPYSFFLHAELTVSCKPEIKRNGFFILLTPLSHSRKLTEGFCVADTFSLIIVQDLPDVSFFLHNSGNKKFLLRYFHFPADVKFSHGAHLDPVRQPCHLFYQERICLHGIAQSSLFSQDLSETLYLFCRLISVKNIQRRTVFFRTPDEYLFFGHFLSSSLFCNAFRSVFPFFVSGSFSV